MAWGHFSDTAKSRGGYLRTAGIWVGATSARHHHPGAGCTQLCALECPKHPGLPPGTQLTPEASWMPRHARAGRAASGPPSARPPPRAQPAHAHARRQACTAAAATWPRAVWGAPLPASCSASKANIVASRGQRRRLSCPPAGDGPPLQLTSATLSTALCSSTTGEPGTARRASRTQQTTLGRGVGGPAPGSSPPDPAARTLRRTHVLYAHTPTGHPLPPHAHARTHTASVVSRGDALLSHTPWARVLAGSAAHFERSCMYRASRGPPLLAHWGAPRPASMVARCSPAGAGMLVGGGRKERVGCDPWRRGSQRISRCECCAVLLQRPFCRGLKSDRAGKTQQRVGGGGRGVGGRGREAR